MTTPNYYKPVEVDGKLYIPEWCYEDTPIEIDFVEDGFYVRDLSNERSENSIAITAAKYRDIRKTSYFACRWYPELVEKSIPVIESVLVRSGLHDAFETFPGYQFVRLCGASPKDVIQLPVFGSSSQAADAIMHSQRTLNIMKNYDHAHLFLRKEVQLANECRCIVHKRKVRAVSVYTWIPEEERAALEESVRAFFEQYGQALPYNSSVLELAWKTSPRDDELSSPAGERTPPTSTYSNPFIVEFNSFGVDGFAGASLFDWDKETRLLYHSKEPEFRYPDEFEW